MKITTNRDRCVSAGMCALTAPGVFDQDEVDGRVVVLTTDPDTLQWESARTAVSLCPAQAIDLETAG